MVERVDQVEFHLGELEHLANVLFKVVVNLCLGRLQIVAVLEVKPIVEHHLKEQLPHVLSGHTLDN